MGSSTRVSGRLTEKKAPYRDWTEADRKLLGKGLHAPATGNDGHQIRRTTHLMVHSPSALKVKALAEFRVPHPDIAEIDQGDLHGDHRLVTLGLFHSYGPVPDLVARTGAGEQLVVLGRHTRARVMASLFLARFHSGNEELALVAGFDGFDRLGSDAATDLVKLVTKVFLGPTDMPEIDSAEGEMPETVALVVEILQNHDLAEFQALARWDVFATTLVAALGTLHLLAALPCKAGDWVVLEVSYSEPYFSHRQGETAPSRKDRINPQQEFVIQRQATDGLYARLRGPARRVRSWLRLCGLSPLALVRWEPAVEHVSSLHHLVETGEGWEIEDLYWESIDDKSNAPNDFPRGSSASLSTHLGDTHVTDRRLWIGMMPQRSSSLLWTAILNLLLALGSNRIGARLAAGEDLAAIINTPALALLAAAGTFIATVAKSVSNSVAFRVAPIMVGFLWLTSAIPTATAALGAFEVGSATSAELVVTISSLIHAICAWLVFGTFAVRVWPRWTGGRERFGTGEAVALARLAFYRRRDSFATAWLVAGVIGLLSMAARLGGAGI